jgi:hypothetical protein
MRAGPLSDRRVIDVLNRSFVSVYIVNEDYRGPQAIVPAEERAELARIHREGSARGLSFGTVRSYVLSPNGHPYAVVPALNSRATLATLGRAIDEFKPKPGPPVVLPGPQSEPPSAPADCVTLHLTSRGDDRGSWGAIPAENWIVLTQEEWSKLLPTTAATPGQAWELDRDVTAKILTHFYPQTENNNASIERIEGHRLTAKVLTIIEGVVTARVDGFVTMQHVFYPLRKDAQPLRADVVGLLTFAPGQPPALQLVTTNAVHGKRPFKVAVRTEPQPVR